MSASERLSQLFLTKEAFEAELTRISKRWEAPKLRPDAYDIDQKDLPKQYGRQAR